MTVHVSAALICRDGKLLAARRADEENEGLWELPGGKVEEGETGVDTLKCELREELGCAAGPMWLFDTVEYDYPSFHLSMDCYVCSLPREQVPVASEGIHSEVRWLSRDELFDVDWLPADLAFMRKLSFYWDEAFSDQLL